MNSGFAACFSLLRILALLRAFAYCEFRLRCALSHLTHSGFAARFHLLRTPASLRIFATYEIRLRCAHSGFIERFRLLLLRIPASLLALLRLLRITTSLAVRSEWLYLRAFGNGDSIFVEFNVLYVCSILPDSHQSLSRGRLIVFKESTSLHLG